MATSFSNSGESIISTCVSSTNVKLFASDVDVEKEFDIDETADWINCNGFKKVALQFPDDFMIPCIDVVQFLSKKTTAVLAILADTSYGSCCVDEVKAEHIERVDALVHYGRACLSPIRRLPVFYVFGRRPFDVVDFTTQLKSSLSDSSQNAFLLYDVIYHNHLKTAMLDLTREFPNLQIPALDLPKEQTTTDQHTYSNDTFTRLGRRFQLQEGTNIEDYIIVYIGSESLLQNACLVTFNRCRFMAYDPETKIFKSDAWNVNKQLMRRYYLVERARDAERVGILIGTLGVQDYLTIFDRLKAVIKAAGKKCYNFAMGQINVAKLANLPEIDVFVLIACPENSLIDSSEMYRPVVTPYEMELACDSTRQWTGNYEMDFRNLLPGGLSYHETTPHCHVQHDVSLVTGKVRTLGVDEEESAKDSGTDVGAVVKPNNVVALPGSAAEFLGNRSWKGLEPALGKTPVVKAVLGTKGTATSYENEPGSS